MKKTVSFGTINHCNPEIKITEQNCPKTKELQLLLSKSTQAILKSINAKPNKAMASLTKKCSSIQRCHRENSQDGLRKVNLTSSVTPGDLKGKANIRNKIQLNKQLLNTIKNNYLTRVKQQTKKPSIVSVRKSKEPSINKQAPLKASLHLQCQKLFKNQHLSQMGFNKTEKKLRQDEKNEETEFLFLSFRKKTECFVVLKYLDEGASGKVYLVRHFATGFILCLKMFQKSFFSQQSFRNLIQEIKVQSFVSHPNILNLYGYTADAERIYLLLEPCLGSNAYKRLSRAPIPEKEVRRHAKEICSAVEHLHRCDVIHRDIKAENILFHEGTVKLCDFGWAVYAPMLRSTQCGTPLYTPPEIVKNEPYDSKVDLWCLGVLVYEMLYGTSPFQIRHPSDLMKIVEEKVFFSKQMLVSEAAQNFISLCLEKNPLDRINIRQALEHEFIVSKLSHYRFTLG